MSKPTGTLARKILAGVPSKRASLLTSSVHAACRALHSACQQSYPQEMGISGLDSKPRSVSLIRRVLTSRGSSQKKPRSREIH